MAPPSVATSPHRSALSTSTSPSTRRSAAHFAKNPMRTARYSISWASCPTRMTDSSCATGMSFAGLEPTSSSLYRSTTSASQRTPVGCGASSPGTGACPSSSRPSLLPPSTSGHFGSMVSASYRRTGAKSAAPSAASPASRWMFPKGSTSAPTARAAAAPRSARVPTHPPNSVMSSVKRVLRDSSFARSISSFRRSSASRTSPEGAACAPSCFSTRLARSTASRGFFSVSCCWERASSSPGGSGGPPPPPPPPPEARGASVGCRCFSRGLRQRRGGPPAGRRAGKARGATMAIA
mmetsp:Transcript_10662/g.37043  ORF Transcript_10662/g.37043 Transcript_10662/m.37043 type:complete len:294 (-) Transcript_10662:69-950(-)